MRRHVTTHDLSLGLGLITELALDVHGAVVAALGRTVAHDVVYDACRKAIADGGHLRDALKADTTIVEKLDASEIDRLMEPTNYLGAADAMIDRVLAAIPR